MSGRAVLRNARISPQKARLVANLVRGCDVSEAVERLAFTRKKAASMIQKLIESAVANAENFDDELDIDDLYVQTIMVDKGPVLKRYRPRAQGRATKILKKTSHITLVLAVR